MTKLDAGFRPKGMPLFVRALLELFYGPAKPMGKGVQSLPTALEQDIRLYREAHLKSAFTRAHRGRVLCVSVHSRSRPAR